MGERNSRTTLSTSQPSVPLGLASQRRKNPLLRSTVAAFLDVVEKREGYSVGHSQRVARYSIMLARELALPQPEVNVTRLASLFHDIGKIGIRDRILLKDGDLTRGEYEQMKMHCRLGGEILGNVSDLSDIAPIVICHHEKWDGSGYPYGLSGNEIPIPARIIAVADSYDAMASNRRYRRSLSKDEALQELSNRAGTQFDPDIVKAFISVLSRPLECSGSGVGKDSNLTWQQYAA